MRTLKGLLFLILLYSCSGIKKSERLADHGNLSECHNVVQYYLQHMDYMPKRKKPEEKIVKYSQKGILLDSTNKESLIFYYLLAHYAEDRQLKFNYYKKMAYLGDGEAQWMMGVYYLEGQENERNKDSALYYLTKSSIGSNYKFAALANYELGNIFFSGKIVSKDSVKAINYYKTACLCFGDNSHRPSCEKIISVLNKSHLKDTSELLLYKNTAKYLKLQEKGK